MEEALNKFIEMMKETIERIIKWAVDYFDSIDYDKYIRYEKYKKRVLNRKKLFAKRKAKYGR
ncbi:MAG: hypothetical protein E7D27_15120 [Clostridium celatum]|nr:hypothetical protein [Clostridium celatum]